MKGSGFSPAKRLTQSHCNSRTRHVLHGGGIGLLALSPDELVQANQLGLPVLPLVPYVCMPSPLPRQVRWNRFAQYCSIDFGLPHITVRWAPALSVSWPAQRSLRLRPTDSPSRPMRPSNTGGSGGFVASTAAPIATEWSHPVPGRAFHPAVDQRFSRRTVMAWLHYNTHP
jgi:hypothetical protein